MAAPAVNELEYELTDHLGNVRATFTRDALTKVTLASSADYYPYGTKIPGCWTRTGGAYRYGYQGQYAEDNTDETGYSNFEARMLDNERARWFVPDPANQYWSGYVAMGNNPVSMVDPDGRKGNDYSNGKNYVPREQSSGKGMSGSEQISLGYRNYGGDYSGSFMDYTYLVADAINTINPIAGLFDYAAYLYGGTDRFGNPMSTTQGNILAASMLFPASRGLGAGAYLYDDILRSANSAYKGSTVLGHALSKHAGRNPNIWGKLSGHPSTWHAQGLKHFDDIMNAEGKFLPKTNPQGIQFLEKMLPDGRGMRLNMDGTFKGFID